MEIRSEKQPAAGGRDSGKYGSGGLLLSSADRGWLGLSVELRSHGSGVAALKPASDVEICVDICGNGSLVKRRGFGTFDQTVAGRGTTWISPAGDQEDPIELDISDPLPGILHIYLSPRHFSPVDLGIDCGQSTIAPGPMRVCQDSLLAEIGFALVAELQTETSTGKLLAETLASTLAARLVQSDANPSLPHPFPPIERQGLDRRRLSRVLDYIAANLDGDLTIDRLASIACLSRFYFSRAFKAAVGQSPHQYVSAKRLEHAKALLRRGDKPLVDIALALNFSCQANFTRAFHRAIGQTPGRYRRNSSM